ncbi:MAG: glutamate-1-semialdehyde 2,1-aminomutase [Bacteroidetes bacterium]|nr:glutamate-1-semialdehyde 2,1-aminomutase [Bacteroidota bacterium]
MNKNQSEKLYTKATQYFPGGVNSPVRAFRSVGGTPLFIDKGEGCFIYDADGNKFIDFCCSWGPLILGHANPVVVEKIYQTVKNGSSFGAPTRLENELAELILTNNPFIEKLRFVSSGTEAVMSAIRLARGYTGKDLIIKFDGCYHGHADSMLVKAGSGLATFGISSSSGVPEAVAKDTIVLPLNDRSAIEEAIKRYKENLAAIIIEPVPANNGLLLQDKEYLQFLREITKQNNVLLIFDEVISGFRIGFTGAAGYYNIHPDILTYGKIIGGGMPVGAYGASSEIMKRISPDGSVYQGGTLSGNPVAMGAGIATLKECLKEDFYSSLEKKTNLFVSALNSFSEKNNFPFKVFSIGSIFWFAFSEKEKIQTADAIDPLSMQKFNVLFNDLLEKGIYFGPSGYEVGFISSAHTDDVLNDAYAKICDSIKYVFDQIAIK